MKEVFYPILHGRTPYAPELTTALATSGSQIHGDRQRPTAYRMGANSTDNKKEDEGKVPVDCGLTKSLNYAWALPCLSLKNYLRGLKTGRLAEKRAVGMCRGAMRLSPVTIKPLIISR